jgi:hypothetical protein
VTERWQVAGAVLSRDLPTFLSQLVRACLFTETAHNTPRPYRTSQHLFHSRSVTARHSRNHFLT